MATLKDIRIRLRGVKAIKQITSSMKMVASAKLRVAQKALEENFRPFTAGVSSALEIAWKDFVKGEGKKVLLVPITSDRGLCGGVNSSIIREVKKASRTIPNENLSVAVIGEKGKAALLRELGRVTKYTFKEIGKKPPIVFTDALIVADHLLGETYDYMVLYYNRFVSIVQSLQHEKLITSKQAMMDKMDAEKYEMDDLNTEVLSDLYDYHLACSIFGGLTEQSTSEVGARMSSMDTATKNAGEMINSLTLTYNRRRQAAITTELCEIVGGAEALKG
jgi:ATP synthase F1 gamma subunit